MRYITFFLICILGQCFAGEERLISKNRDITYWCKKAKHKESFHSMPGIDYIYVINEHRNIDKFRRIKKVFAKYDIEPYRFNAVNPLYLSFSRLNGLGHKFSEKLCQRDVNFLEFSSHKENIFMTLSKKSNPKSVYFHESMNLIEIARNLDFLSVIFDAHKAKYDTVWIMDDTIDVLENPHALTTCLDKLDKESPAWDVLYTDAASRDNTDINYWDLTLPVRPNINYETAENYEKRETIVFPISKLGLRKGAYSFILSKKGIDKILNFYKENKFFIPFRLEMQVIPNLNCYILREAVVTNKEILVADTSSVLAPEDQK